MSGALHFAKPATFERLRARFLQGKLRGKVNVLAFFPGARRITSVRNQPPAYEPWQSDR